MRHYSGLCLALKNGTNALYLSKSCDEGFIWTKYNTIMHVKTSMCLIPESGEDDAKIIAKKECKNLNGAFMLSANLSLQHIKTSKCLHPYWGCPVPSQGEDIVLHTACNEERLKFEFLKGMICFVFSLCFGKRELCSLLSATFIHLATAQTL